jgi:hypothetical protein
MNDIINIDGDDEIVEVPAPAFTTNADATRVIGEWISAYARGAARDQNSVLLDRIVKERVAAQKQSGTRRPVNIEGEVARFIDRYIAGELTDSPLAAKLEGHLNIRAHDLADVLMHDAQLAPQETNVTVFPDAAAAELSESVRTLEAKVERLETECTRAHDWRFHLESRARDAHRMIEHLYRVARRAPTKDEFEGLLNTLKEAIGWTP